MKGTPHFGIKGGGWGRRHQVPPHDPLETGEWLELRAEHGAPADAFVVAVTFANYDGEAVAISGGVDLTPSLDWQPAAAPVHLRGLTHLICEAAGEDGWREAVVRGDDGAHHEVVRRHGHASGAQAAPQRPRGSGQHPQPG